MNATPTTPEATPMTTLTAPQYTISWDPEVDLFLVLDANLDHVADGETMGEARAEIERLMVDDLRSEIERRLWDVTDLETLRKIAALI